MPIVVACRCGQRFRAIDELAGKCVTCPACGQPLAIPPANAPSAPVGDPLDLGDLSRLEQSAAASGPLGLAGGDPRRIGVPAYAARHAQPEESLNRWLIVAMCVAGGVVLLVLGAIVLSPLWSGSGGASRERSAGEAAAKSESATASAKPPADRTTAKTEQGSKPPAAVPQSPRTESGVAGVKREPPASGTREPTAPANTLAPASPSTQQPGAMSIKLSAGTALPQTLPTGTAMGFSVDYEFVSGRPDEAAKYLWVIKSAEGRTVKQQVHLRLRGTLEGFVLEFRPEHGPFQTGLEDAQGRKLTELSPLR